MNHLFEKDVLIVNQEAVNPRALTPIKPVQQQSKISPPAELEGTVTPKDTELAVAYVEQAFQIQLERLQIIVDASLLAVEQVQDKRIEVLEQGKNVTVEDVIFDLLSVYLWEVGILGHVLTPLIKEVTSVICAKSLAMQAVYDRIPKTDYGAQIIGMGRSEKEGKEIIRTIIQDHVRNPKQFTSEQYAMFTKSVTDLISKAPDQAAAKVKSTIKNWKSLADKVKTTALKTTDTPNVALLKAAQSYASRNRTALHMQKSNTIAFIRSNPRMSKKELKEFVRVFAWEEIPDVQFIRDQYQMALEIVVWAQLYRFKANDPSSPEVLLNSGKFRGINDKIVDYWIIRFRSVLESYEKVSKEPWDTMPRGIKCKKIKAYFEDISKKLDEVSNKVKQPINKVFVVIPSAEEE
ncbi:hypothetical protein SY83_16995 [Paenibacillus swuensis]|uniref:Uncharacterized protein n=1 Tax=Paenibacillus swuensis TaxID=1178515 RepID=A0A172TL44_9BACL|nr:hypothetical protein [Paenibacillus swuensis]ANE47696.1 hypothetical protein SY83_16995 [Paenibacillus swuensis]